MVPLFDIPSLEIYIPFNGCRCTGHKNLNASQNQNVFLSFQGHKMHLLALLGQLQTERTDFPTFSFTVTSEIPTLSCT